MSSSLIRNIGIIAHIDAGKTTTTEKLLFHSGFIPSPGSVDSGTTTTDYLPQERARGITIKSAVITFPWNGHTINLIDTPGHVDFGGEVVRALKVMDGAVCILDASQGVEAQTVSGWKLACQYGIGKIIFINKVDKVGADIQKCLSSIGEKLSVTPFLLQKQVDENSLIDLVNMKKLTFDQKGSVFEEDFGENKSIRREMMETLAEKSDLILESLINDTPICAQIIKSEIAKIVRKEKSFVPVIFGSSLKNFGTLSILNAITDYLPEPAVTHKIVQCLAFKVTFQSGRPVIYIRVYGPRDSKLTCHCTVYNVSRKSNPIRIHKLFKVQADELVPVDYIPAGGIGVIINNDESSIQTGDTLSTDRTGENSFGSIDLPKPVFMRRIEAPTRDSWDQLDVLLGRFSIEDPSFQVMRDKETGQTLIAGMGELHLDVIHRRIREEFKVESELGPILVRKCITLKRDLEIPFEEFGLVLIFKRLPMGEHNSIKNINMIKIQEEILRIPVESALNMGIEGLAFIGIEVSIKRNDLGNPPAIMDQIKFYELIKERLLSVAQYEQMEPMVAADISSPPQYTGEILRDLYANRFGTLISQDDKCQKVTNVKAIMPLETSIGYATWLRGLSSGNATLAIHNIGYIAGKI
jgi:elongation factor G